MQTKPLPKEINILHQSFVPPHTIGFKPRSVYLHRWLASLVTLLRLEHDNIDAPGIGGGTMKFTLPSTSGRGPALFQLGVGEKGVMLVVPAYGRFNSSSVYSMDEEGDWPV